MDLGCGNGEWTEPLAPLCDEMHACDFSPDFVDEVHRRTVWHRACFAEVSDLRAYSIPRGADHLLRRIKDAAAQGAHVVIRDYCTFNLGLRTVYPRGATSELALAA